MGEGKGGGEEKAGKAVRLECVAFDLALSHLYPCCGLAVHFGSPHRLLQRHPHLLQLRAAAGEMEEEKGKQAGREREGRGGRGESGGGDVCGCAHRET